MRIFAALIAAAVFAVHAATPVTHNCKANFGNGEVILNFNSAMTMQEVFGVVADPARDPGLYARLWSPFGARVLGVDWGVIRFESVQDTDEIAAGLRADPVLAARGVKSAWANTANFCFAAMPPPRSVLVMEYFNRNLGHYFLSSNEAESALIDAGGAGEGWERTGESFRAIEAGACYDSYPVFRFYTFGANSHFFTVSPEECGIVRRTDPGWIFEGEVFGAHEPVDGTCPGRMQPIYRLYNNRWMFNDSNHRFVTRLDLYEQMRSRGWIGEGLAFCVGQR